MQKKHRIFIAINLPQDVRKFLAGFQKKWPELPAKWTNAENLHITLVFLGDLTDEELGQVCIIVKDVVKNHASFNIDLNKVAYGPENKIPPRYVWVGGQKSKELSAMKTDLEDPLLEKVRFRPETRAFSTHITLARVKTLPWRAMEPEERPEIGEDIDVVFTVESIEVMESELSRSGPRYTVIESYQLLS